MRISLDQLSSHVVVERFRETLPLSPPLPLKLWVIEVTGPQQKILEGVVALSAQPWGRGARAVELLACIRIVFSEVQLAATPRLGGSRAKPTPVTIETVKR